MDTQKLLWKPSEDFISKSNLKKFESWLLLNKGLSFDGYQELWEWSVQNIEVFWESIWEYFEIISDGSYKKVLDGGIMPDVNWFKGTQLNYAEHIFRQKSDERPALIFQKEGQGAIEIPWEKLEKEVCAMREYLIAQGVGKGDRVVGYLPNIPETITCFLAINSLGAIWSCCSPDFGVSTVLERFQQIEPKIFIAADGYQYNGKPHNRIEVVQSIRNKIKSIQDLVLIPYLDGGEKEELVGTTLWEDIQNDYGGSKLSFTRVPFNHPIWVLYSSGTTGKPKAITHSHGGVLLEHLKYLAFHNDAKPGENFFWFSTTGWMMWNFLQASMLVGAVPVLFDGSPVYPSFDALWKLTEKLPIHHFGTSAPYLTAMMKKDVRLSEKFDFSSLRSIGSTGAPLPPEAFEWIYNNIAENLWLCSVSGGTDVCTAFVGGNPYAPVYKGAIQARSLGCAIKAYNEDGDEVEESLGEMVIEKPLPSMPAFFWNDPNNERYLSSYFEKYPGIWRHGDWIKIFKNGSLVIYGRSDSTLNRKGIRIGTAEIYNALDEIVALKDSLVLNLEKKDGSDIMPLFVVLQEGHELGKELEQEIKTKLKTKCSPRHVPDQIIKVPDIPYTLSGKKMEVPVKRLFMGMDSAKTNNKEAVRNPEAMIFFENYAKSFE